ncbi:hypothetical protein CQA18_25855, partial [Enterobacter hormaechei]
LIRNYYRFGWVIPYLFGASPAICSSFLKGRETTLEFWQAWAGVQDAESGKEQISAGYFRLIRNYYRFGWVIPYLFGASPAICSSFLKGRETT